MKNSLEIVAKLNQVKEGSLSPVALLQMINNLDFAQDCSDGFEDVLDAVRPFIKQLAEYPDFKERDILAARLDRLITLLESKASLPEIESVALRYEKNKIYRIDTDPLILLTFAGLVVTFLIGLLLRYLT